ncbi:MAG: protease complex subunit PrcB family protein [Firmicutes bacterium]|nr:protease complex subunit PrcB family protein [Bacillota bacterium]
MKGKWRLAAVILAGVMFIVGVGFSAKETVPALVNQVQFVLNDREVQPSDRPGYYFNGVDYVPEALNYKGTNYVPLRFVAEVLGLKVAWDQETRSIILGETIAVPPVAPPDPEKKPSFQMLNPAEAPQGVRDLINRSRELELAQTITVGEETYLVVTRGVKPTGGYAVEIESVVDTGEEIEVQVRYVDPAPDAIVTQALTYPVALAVLPKVEKPVRFIGVDEAYIPQLWGLDYLEPVVAEGSTNIKLLSPTVQGSELTVRGVARVWEAALNWEILADGKVVDEGCLMTASGAPDWGYFSLTLPTRLAQGENYFLRLFWSSPKDGSPLDVVEVSLDSYRSEAKGR